MTVPVQALGASCVVSHVHVGSAHTDTDSAVLFARTEHLLHPDQEVPHMEGCGPQCKRTSHVIQSADSILEEREHLCPTVSGAGPIAAVVL